MDASEYQIRTAELDLRHREFELRQDQLNEDGIHAKRSHRTARWAVVVALTSVVVSMIISSLTVIITSAYYRNQIRSNQRQLLSSQNQFIQTARASEYNDIINGLSSGSGAVQINALRRLVSFVELNANFDGNVIAQDEAWIDALQTIQAFVKETTPNPTAGLSSFTAPESDVALKAMAQLRTLAEDRRSGPSGLDLSHVDLKGISLTDFVPRVNFYAPSSDFRMAILHGLNLSFVTGTFTDGFFACADLRGAKFGKAHLDGVDFAGADLSGVDFSEVSGLTSAQIAHAIVDTKTRYPAASADRAAVRPPSEPWQNIKGQCSKLVSKMTGMIPGEGYDPGKPCPSAEQTQDIVDVCEARQ